MAQHQPSFDKTTAATSGSGSAGNNVSRVIYVSEAKHPPMHPPETHHHGSEPKYMCDGSAGHHGSTILLPLFDESKWPIWVRILAYSVGLMNFFIGISYGVDIFMSAAEKITSKTVRVKDPNSAPGESKFKTVLFWNQTVATLTLGAVATCSPEILLNVAETISALSRGLDAGSLGPGTIIGSAAFNLMVTTAVCIYSVPTPATRKIEQTEVYVTTTLFSIFAYVWIIFVLDTASRKTIEIWEAMTTVGFFFLLVICAYIADSKMPVVHRLLNNLKFWKRGRKVTPSALTEVEVPEVTVRPPSSASLQPPSSRISNQTGRSTATDDAKTARRQNAGNSPSKPGGRDARNAREERPRLSWYNRKRIAPPPSGAFIATSAVSTAVAIFSFATKRYALSHEDKSVCLKVVRSGDISTACEVTYGSVEGTAKMNTDFVSKSGKLRFGSKEIEKTVTMDVVAKEEQLDADQVFYVKLTLPIYPKQKAKLGQIPMAEVNIIDGHEETMIAFKEKRALAKESSGSVKIKLERTGKISTTSTCLVLTRDGTAAASKNYVASSTETAVKFEPGELEKSIKIDIINTGELSQNLTFECLLDNLEGAKLGFQKILSVIITTDDEVDNKLAEASKLVTEMLEEKKSWQQAWKNHFIKAMSVNNGDVMSATKLDYILHALSFYWKLMYACLPPTCFFNGYLSYVLALLMIGALTTVVGDLAQIFGCLIGLNDVVVAAMFISVGTNLPDLFASRFAAIQDHAADNAVGHIQGSICVNVFLGLGVPWLVASSYKQYKGERFEINTDELWWCVTVYVILSIISTALLLARRMLKACGNAVLGGPKFTKAISSIFLVAMWIMYVAMTGLKSGGFLW